jgi:NAD(P)H-dependent flavin oxidoreductase YrpB (nitropropane dioxygenase family)
MKKLKIGNILPKIPLVQGGMAIGVSLDNLASAVANEGGIGVIGTAGIGLVKNDDNSLKSNLDALKYYINKIKEKTKGIFGVNIMVALNNYEKYVKTAIEEGAKIVFSGAGLPLSLPELNKEKKAKLVPIVSSVKAAQVIFKRWMKKYNYVPDAYVVESSEAGGHLGFKKDQLNDSKNSTLNLAKEMVDFRDELYAEKKIYIPIIAAGGINTKEKAKQLFEQGVDGIQVGSAFIPTEECDADINFKNLFIKSSTKDIGILNSPVGLPGRAIKTKFFDDIESGKAKPKICNYQCIKTCDFKKVEFCIAQALYDSVRGDIDNGVVFSGENGPDTDSIKSVQQIIKNIMDF